MIDVGLGRGVDATNPKPWQNKSSFQVRKVNFDSVIGTEEGGSLQSYEREVTSVYTQQTDLKASITVPKAPVNIGVDAEQSRSFSNTRRSVGKRVINRTISYRADFEDIPQSQTNDPNAARLAAVSPHPSYAATEAESNKTVADAQSTHLTFEERLAKWIIERFLHRQDVEEIRATSEGKPLPKRRFDFSEVNPAEDIAKLIHDSTIEDRKAILQDCRDFVHFFRITHYVSAVQLGAAEYRVFSETEYYARIGASGTFGLEALANLTVSENISWKRTKKASDLKRIGRIDKFGLVARGTYDEAVVGIDIQPITNLVRLRYLQLALRRALLEYVEEEGDSTGE